MPRNNLPRIQDVVLILRIPKPLRARLKKVAKARGLSMAAVVRTAIVQEVDRGT